MEEQPGAKPDYLMEAARAHASAAKVWEALVERDRLLSASSKASEGARAAARAVGGPAARLVKAAALRALPPVPKALALEGVPPPPPAAKAPAEEPLAPAAVRKSALPQAKPKAPVQAAAAPAPKRTGRKSTRVRTRPPSEYEYETSVYYTSESEEPAGAAACKAEGRAAGGPPAKPRPALRQPVEEPAAAKRTRVRRTQLRRSSPHRRRKRTHPKRRLRTPGRDARPRGRSASKSCYRPGEYRPRGHSPSQTRGVGSRAHAAGRQRTQERAPERSESSQEHEGPAELATAPYRCSPQRRVPFEEYRSHPGVAGRPRSERGRSAVRDPVVPEERSRSRSRPAVRLQGNSRGACRTRRSEEPGCTEVHLPRFNSEWQTWSVLRKGLSGDGFGLRRSMDLEDMDPVFCVHWNKKFSGRQVADDWVELAEGGFIPMDINGVRHVVAHGPQAPPGGNALRGLMARAQSSGGKGTGGGSTTPGPKGSQGSRVGKGCGKSAKSSALKGAAIPMPQLCDFPDSPPPDEEGSWNARAAAAARPWKQSIEHFLIPWDDEHFRRRIPDLLPRGWDQLSHRQVKRLVRKVRKTQHVWRFEEQGGFREYVLARMQADDFAKLQDEQKESCWQTYRSDGQEPVGADGVAAGAAAGSALEPRGWEGRAPRPGEFREGAGRASQSRPRRRICGMDSSSS